ncbi:MAG: acyltransferase [Betaproteobacteria bacterium]
MNAAAPSHIDALTGVRAYAALSVLVFHAWLNAGHPSIDIAFAGFALDLSPYAKYGWIGVDIFFVLSGFLLTRVAFARIEAGRTRVGDAAKTTSVGEPYWSFLRRRILRVFPAYFACISVLVALALAGVYRSVPGNLDLFLHLWMSHNFVEKYITSMNGVFWTLPFEWHFYLLFPLLFALLRRAGPVALFAAAACVVLATKAQVMLSDDGFGQLLVLIRLDAFCAGMAASAISLRHPMTRPVARASAITACAMLAAVPYVFERQPGVVHYYDVAGFMRPFWIHLCICLVLCAITGARTKFVSLFDHPVVVGLGTISYSIYLWHLPVVELLAKAGTGQADPPSARGYFVLVAMTLAVVVPLSIASWVLVERPFQRAGRNVSGSAALDPVVVLGIWAAALLATTMTINAIR